MVPKENDIPDGIVSKVSELCLKEPSAQNANEKPRYFEQYLSAFKAAIIPKRYAFTFLIMEKLPKSAVGWITRNSPPEQSVEDILLHFAE